MTSGRWTRYWTTTRTSSTSSHPSPQPQPPATDTDPAFPPSRISAINRISKPPAPGPVTGRREPASHHPGNTSSPPRRAHARHRQITSAAGQPFAPPTERPGVPTSTVRKSSDRTGREQSQHRAPVHSANPARCWLVEVLVVADCWRACPGQGQDPPSFGDRVGKDTQSADVLADGAHMSCALITCCVNNALRYGGMCAAILPGQGHRSRMAPEAVTEA
jgi:hypothetical protein